MSEVMPRRHRKRTPRKTAQHQMRRRFCAALVCMTLAVTIGIGLTSLFSQKKDPDAPALVSITSTQTPPPTLASILTPMPTKTPTLDSHLKITDVDSASAINARRLNFRQRAFRGTKADKDYLRTEPISMGAPDEYAQLEGITTFRGNHYRDGASIGTIPNESKELSVIWSVSVGAIEEWNGIGWTGQASIVRWPDDVRIQMNIKPEKQKTGLVEVIIGCLDGKIRFLDLEDGKQTRSSISVPAPIKGSIAVDPRGYPILYCGQGLFEVRGRTVPCGMRMFNLLDGRMLHFLSGNDRLMTRSWFCFDAAPLIDASTDTMLQVGENGLLYTVKLNTDYNRETGKISVDPSIDRWGYKSNVTKRPGMESSIAIYNNYGYFTDNSGLLMCVDLNTLNALWAFPTGDDSDATPAIEQDADGIWLYTANEMDLRGNAGPIQMRCLNALTGKERWRQQSFVSGRPRAGAFASPALGKGQLRDLVFFNISKTNKGGTLFALEKATGKAAWKLGLGSYSWSTPLVLYDDSGKGYLLISNSSGTLRLLDGFTGTTITELELGQNIEGSPASFGDIAVVGTRGGRILGIRIS